MRASSWALPVLSVVSLLVIAGSVGWAEATDAQPHVVSEESTEATEAADAGNPADAGEATDASYQLCATGDYAAYATLPDDGNAKSATVQPGACVTQALPSAGEHSVTIFGLEGTTPFEVGQDEVAPGEKLSVIGTIESPDYSVE